LSLPNPTIIVAVDPGRSKSGLAVVSGPNPMNILEHSVVESKALLAELQATLQRVPEISLLVMGNGTGSASLLSTIHQNLPDLEFTLVDERSTSELARARFIAEEPLPLLQRMLPRGLRSPTRPYDDYVAIILAEQYFSRIR